MSFRDSRSLDIHHRPDVANHEAHHLASTAWSRMKPLAARGKSAQAIDFSHDIYAQATPEKTNSNKSFAEQAIDSIDAWSRTHKPPAPESKPYKISPLDAPPPEPDAQPYRFGKPIKMENL